MKSQIVLPSLRIHARHGVFEQERSVGSWFRVSLVATVECDDRLIEADSLEGTVDYGLIVGCIRDCMKTPSRLLEHLVLSTGRCLMARFPSIAHLELSIAKENPPLGCQCGEFVVKMAFSR